MTEPNSTLNRILYCIFIPFMLIFLLYVGIGYFISLSTEFPNTKLYVILVISIIVAIVIFLVIRSSAFEFNRASQATGWKPYIGPVILFLLLLGLSAYGFLSASMLLFEGPPIARENTEKAIGHLQRLMNSTPGLLADSKYNELSARVVGNSNQLMKEIEPVKTGTFCGIGDTAKKRIALIKADLPDVDVLSGTDVNHNCSDQKNIKYLKDTYLKLIMDSLANSQIARSARIAERQALAGEIKTILSADIAKLTQVRKALSSLPSFLFDIKSYHDSVAALDEASTDYAASIGKLGGFVDLTNFGLPLSIEETSLAKMSSGLQIVETILNRINHPSVVILVIFAVLADIFATFITFRAIRYQVQLNIEEQNSREILQLSQSGVDYLWRPRMHPLRRT